MRPLLPCWKKSGSAILQQQLRRVSQHARCLLPRAPVRILYPRPVAGEEVLRQSQTERNAGHDARAQGLTASVVALQQRREACQLAGPLVGAVDGAGRQAARLASRGGGGVEAVE